ncbi:tRNA glutamyl-Q(34) synthetase GluQRS [Janthinobacterium sp. PC23-8]|uniref:tRNA glutamyl-Q(34) synthetase GluQRS n=1 Tax=Janthinobacterium sp. PC23-8 TaxID=2012679 RepID=UPI000B960648|nr:tRNA glutamyl-Q(34) synthetase GluQRS [Janthinobacterium sp. PC23-8]OYO26552.1 tRNA glutamyl-Q(34) synthetase GluQRS [Janthinobacterium sp. PC23-8]
MPSSTAPYIGRFAPSPSGPLHMGSLVAAMASYLDAKVHHGAWLLRIEDLDYDRNVDGADAAILASLRRCGMTWDGEATWQSRRLPLYEAALQRLREDGLVYACGCSRKEIHDSVLRAGAAGNGAMVYPGTCRHGLAPGKVARGLRLRVPDGEAAVYGFVDRWHGALRQHLADEAGDFIVLRGDGYWAYQLAVVVDDGEQGVTQVVRGADLLDSTPRQLYLQDALGLPHPGYLHVPVVNNALGEKLSKQTGALAFDTGTPALDLLASALLPAARFLGLDVQANNLDDFWRRAIPAWARRLSERP